ncbi:spore germination protein GerW family protein [Pontibacter rugosus]|uniref:Spore germination protein GerW family protein n=1 Tax=Pontibacter rugosus TaxID=1745966 RepID=A0ABW3SLE7_9BACT
MENDNISGNTAHPTITEKLAEKFGKAAHVSTIYGEPVERDGLTVIPVSKAIYGFGGGQGGKADAEGSGGGGGMVVMPVGYIEMKQGETKFRTIRDPQSIVKIVAIGSIATLLIARSITKIFRK